MKVIIINVIKIYINRKIPFQTYYYKKQKEVVRFYKL
jgi:hypothetical protein